MGTHSIIRFSMTKYLRFYNTTNLNKKRDTANWHGNWPDGQPSLKLGGLDKKGGTQSWCEVVPYSAFLFQLPSFSED